MKILIANRGEIACRIIRTAHRLGHTTVAVYGDPDANAPHVAGATESYRLGPADLAQSYLNQDRLLAAIADTSADAVHPGYGFLAENAEFARAVVAAGCTWIGPHPEAVERMGSKIEARRIAVAAGVPVIPGFDESQEPNDLAAAAERIGYPVLVKAAAGGGGKGIRIVHEAAGFAAALAEAATEAERSFGDRAMIVERYIQRPRHVEVQLVGDRHGNAIHLGTRECSVQRRYQKVLEEAPAPNLPDATRVGLHDAAIKLANAMRYDSAGTIEFIVDDATGDYFFLEMNTRLQVEHPVTEEITGLDIVELMINSALGEPLPLTQDDVTFTGHAFEARINAEDPATGFTPQIGQVTALAHGGAERFHSGAASRQRWDAAIGSGDEVTPFYDSMIAKLIVWDECRTEALASMRDALDALRIDGLVTTAPFHRWLVDQPPVIAGRVTTRFLDETDVPADPALAAPAAAAIWRDVKSLQGRFGGAAKLHDPWHQGCFRLTPHRSNAPVILRALDGVVHEISPTGFPPNTETEPIARTVDVDRRIVRVRHLGYPHEFTVLERSDAWAPNPLDAAGVAGAIAAPFPGVVAEVHVVPGQSVDAGSVVVVIE
ncbi:MAG TPA: biotin carboxylase N-terminal domain-containing protein, partial [Ilumatobacter sp.]|nr:biotin carboxylase N-terminal domain-containing protein [Ilumatobacter sp.]